MRYQKGFNMIELLVALVVLALSIFAGVPSTEHIIGKRRLAGAAEEAESNLRLLRAEAVRHNRTAFVHFSSGASWFYGLDDRAACNAAVADDCTIDDNERRVRGSHYPGVSMTASFAADTTGFEPRRGMALNSGAIEFHNRTGTLRIVVSALGNLRLCTPAGNDAVAGYPQC